MRVDSKHCRVHVDIQGVCRLSGWVLWLQRVGLYLQDLSRQRERLANFHLIDQIFKSHGWASFLAFDDYGEHQPGCLGRSALVLSHQGQPEVPVALQTLPEVQYPATSVHAEHAWLRVCNAVPDQSVQPAVSVLCAGKVQGCARWSGLGDPNLIQGRGKLGAVVVDIHDSYVHFSAAAGWGAAELRLDSEDNHGLGFMVQRLQGADATQPPVNGEGSIQIARGNSVRDWF